MNKAIKIKQTCNCGNDFFVVEYQLQRGRGKYCSKECKYKYSPHIKRGKGSYVLVSENTGRFSKGHTPWHKGIVFSDNSILRETPGKYGYIHKLIRKSFEKTGCCENCKENKVTEWANKDNKYLLNRDNWMELCKKCHAQYDNKLKVKIA